jgi:peptidyl-prolyl cis-trans isomerase SurA
MTIEALFLTQFYSRMNVTEEEVENFIKRERIHEEGDINYDLIEFVIIDEKKILSKKIIDELYQSVINIGFKKTKDAYNEYNIDIRNMGVVNIDKLPNIFITALKEKIDKSYTKIIKSSKGYHVLKVLSSTNKASTFVDEYKVRHILLVPDIMTTDKEIKDRLYKMRNEIKDIDEFAEFAKKYSADKASGFKGGDLNWVRVKSLVPEFGKVMTNIPLNKISDPFMTQFGWHILYVENKRTIDDAKSIIKNNIANAIRVNKAKRERDDWMAKLKEQAFIEIKEF